MKNFILDTYYKAVRSIGFYPAIISLVYFTFALLLLTIDLSEITGRIVELFPWLIFRDMGTPRAILTTLLAGILSLTVLSFSMVMVVLGQAASNYSPKILLGLIGEKSHQIVLGHYLGAIIYFLVLLAAFRQSANYHLPSIGVFISIAIGIWCLSLFVYFIHNTSQSIQINYIIRGIYDKTRKELEIIREINRKTAEVEGQGYHTTGDHAKSKPGDQAALFIHSAKSGYVQRWNSQTLARMAEKEGWTIHLLFQQGDYLLEEYPVIKVEYWSVKPDKQQEQDILSQLAFYDGENISEHYHYGFTQLMEIAIKALSPGINDPGTARLCIQYLTDLLRVRIDKDPGGFIFDENGRPLLTWKTHSFESLLYKSLAPIQQYGKSDISICMGLFQALKTLAWFDKEARYKTLLQQQCDSVMECLKNMNLTESDKAFIIPRISGRNSYLEARL